jgi:hypothetical protein
MLCSRILGDCKVHFEALGKTKNVSPCNNNQSDLKWRTILDAKPYKIVVSKTHKDADVLLYFLPKVEAKDFQIFFHKVHMEMLKENKAHRLVCFVATPDVQEHEDFNKLEQWFQVKHQVICRMCEVNNPKKFIEDLLATHLPSHLRRTRADAIDSILKETMQYS